MVEKSTIFASTSFISLKYYFFKTRHRFSPVPEKPRDWWTNVGKGGKLGAEDEYGPIQTRYFSAAELNSNLVFPN